MATLAAVTSRVRTELGDIPDPFRTPVKGDGEQKKFELGQRNIIASSVSVYILHSDLTTTTLASPTNYSLDLANGDITFVIPPAPDQVVVIEGSTGGMFTDAEMSFFVNDAVAMHTKDRVYQSRYRDGHGFIRYDDRSMDLTHLPDSEVNLVTLLATIQALWALAVDASSDINISTPEGTSIPRGQRFSQIMQMIDSLTSQYKELSAMMGVGIYAPEVFTVRRKSRLTGRLVPIFKSREYDDATAPVRVLPVGNNRDEDPDGPLSPWWPSGVGGN